MFTGGSQVQGAVLTEVAKEGASMACYGPKPFNSRVAGKLL